MKAYDLRGAGYAQLGAIDDGVPSSYSLALYRAALDGQVQDSACLHRENMSFHPFFFR